MSPLAGESGFLLVAALGVGAYFLLRDTKGEAEAPIYGGGGGTSGGGAWAPPEQPPAPVTTPNPQTAEGRAPPAADYSTYGKYPAETLLGYPANTPNMVPTSTYQALNVPMSPVLPYAQAQTYVAPSPWPTPTPKAPDPTIGSPGFSPGQVVTPALQARMNTPITPVKTPLPTVPNPLKTLMKWW